MPYIQMTPPFFPSLIHDQSNSVEDFGCWSFLVEIQQCAKGAFYMQIVLNVKWGPYKEVLSPGNRKQARKVTLKGCSHHRPRKPNNRRYPLPFHSGFEVNIKYPVLLHVEYLYLSHQGNIFCLVEYLCL